MVHGSKPVLWEGTLDLRFSSEPSPPFCPSERIFLPTPRRGRLLSGHAWQNRRPWDLENILSLKQQAWLYLSQDSFGRTEKGDIFTGG
ncbi:hypothetical protein [Xanthocytophaga agilis]|uniref:Uncharacterized protein n=1 Tax=Xanthocytophaga agilis TaxID=3048010 RepID=A0AAE3UHU7_9BACT|nr:hypothetical protein [Xanthocytophaga agilis]MDJ1506413.1 hypothetical protein [Xanthocytophaga agilis]